MGRLIGTTTQYTFLSGNTYTNDFTYDAASNRTGFTAPDGSTNTYGYDNLNRLTSLTNSLTGQFGFGYDALSRRTSLTRPNNVNTSYSYDSLSRLLSVLHQAGGATIDGASYTLDNAGNRTSKINQLNGVTENYTYDPLYELTQVQQVVSGNTNTTESYSYDSVGNRLSSLNVVTYSYNNSNQLTSSSDGYSYTYDFNGSTLTKSNSTGTTQYAWDFENRLTSVTLPNGGGIVSYRYDPFGRRIQKSGSSGITNYVYDLANAIEELDGSGTETAKYAQGPTVDEPLTEVRSGITSYYEEDGLGSITTLTNSAAGLAQSYTYRTFGGVLASSGTVTNPFQYTSRDFDAETGLVYMRARYFDSTTGRFLSEDPLQFNAGNNFYEYSYNNPVNFKDPTGLQPAPNYVSPPPSFTVITGGAATSVAAGEGSAPVLTLVAGGSAEGAGGGPVGALVGIIAAAGTYDTIEGYKLGVAFGWWKPFSQSQPDSAPAPECTKTKWKCRVRCALINLRTGSADRFIETNGVGATEGEAYDNGQRQLQNSPPPGFRTKHCHQVGRCQRL
jgi:RHS repeat-associated protein